MMDGDERTPVTFSWIRRWGAALNLLITTAAVAALMAGANYLVIRHYTRWHWNADVEGQLSKRTHTVLESLTNNVKIIAYYNSKDPLYPRVKGLLNEYALASSRIQVQLVDYMRDVGAAKAIKEQYQLKALADKDLIIFDCNGRTKTVYGNELSDYDYSKLMSGESNEVERTHFKGELLFTSKIYAAANERPPIVYFLLGHGERPPDNGDNPEGYGRFRALLEVENNFEMRPLILGGTNEVPSQCNLLVIAGPTDSFDRSELDAIQRYLEQGGRLLVAFNITTVQRGRQTGLERLLARWGIEVGENIIVDRPHSAQGSSVSDVIPVDIGKHPAVNSLAGSRVQLFVPRSIRALRPVRRSDEMHVDELLLTGPETVMLNGRREIDPTQRGPQPLMVALEKGVPGLQRGATRIIVIGDSLMWGNQGIESLANREFAASCANWLVSQNLLLGDIPRRAIHNYKLTMTRAQLRSVQLILLLGIPGGVLLLGTLVWARRRH
jgi:hypothetical protein